MKRKCNDFTITPNTQSERVQTNLWNVMVGGKRYTTVVGQEKAQRTADALNLDPNALERGETRAARAAGQTSTLD
jgi:hypothetical protein